MENINSNTKKSYALVTFLATAVNTIIMLAFSLRAEFYYLDFMIGDSLMSFFTDSQKEQQSCFYVREHGDVLKMLPFIATIFSAMALILLFFAIINSYKLSVGGNKLIYRTVCIFNIVSLLIYVISCYNAVHLLNDWINSKNEPVRCALNLFWFGLESSALSVVASVLAYAYCKKEKPVFNRPKYPAVILVVVSFVCSMVLFVFSTRAGYYFLYEKYVEHLRKNPLPADYFDSVSGLCPGEKGRLFSELYNIWGLDEAIRPMAQASAAIALLGFIIIVFAVVKVERPKKEYKRMAFAYFVANVCSFAVLMAGRLSAMQLLQDNKAEATENGFEITFSNTFGLSYLCVIMSILNVVAGALALFCAVKKEKTEK